MFVYLVFLAVAVINIAATHTRATVDWIGLQLTVSTQGRAHSVHVVIQGTDSFVGWNSGSRSISGVVLSTFSTYGVTAGEVPTAAEAIRRLHATGILGLTETMIDPSGPWMRP